MSEQTFIQRKKVTNKQNINTKKAHLFDDITIIWYEKYGAFP